MNWGSMTSPSTQFAPVGRMGIYDPFHQTSMWEDMYKGAISPNTGLSIITQADVVVENKPEYTSHEALGPSENNQAVKSLSDKIQRRLAQNREAARKSRLRKKAYVQQLETSRLKLAQLEQELERARQQGAYIGSAFDTIYTGFSGTFSSGVAAFEMEYGHWAEELQKKNCELKSLLQGHVGDIELQGLVQSILKHYSSLFRMKGEVAKVDVSYLISGAWRTSVERLFLWIGGFRPSELLTVLLSHLHPLTDEQLVSVGNLRRSCHQAEDALSQGIEKLRQTLLKSITTETFGSGSYRSQMASAVDKLEALESFANQADHLRQQTLAQMSRILTIHQAARGLLALGDYFQRLRALSSHWAARPREPA